MIKYIYFFTGCAGFGFTIGNIWKHDYAAATAIGIFAITAVLIAQFLKSIPD